MDMETIIKNLNDAERAVNSFAWGPVMLALLVGTGIFLTIRTRWIQVGGSPGLLEGAPRHLSPGGRAGGDNGVPLRP